MTVLIVIENTRRWPLELPGVRVVSARDYLTRPEFSELHGAAVFNLCRGLGYQSTGYYVSLLATGRGHRPLPSVTTIQDLRSNTYARIVSDDENTLIQRSLADIRAERFTLSIYFGRNVAKRHDRLAHALFNQFPAPLLRAEFANKAGAWQLERMRAIGTAEIADDHKPFVLEQAAAYFSRPRFPGRSGPQARFDLAILYDPTEENGPSDPGAIRRFERAARRLNMQPTLIGREDFARIPEFDALFIRETTQVNHHTYRFARRAAAEGMVVIDDPESIVRCTNKVYLAEVFTRNRVATPRTMIVHRDNVRAVSEEIGLPCVLKRPDSSFSMGVMKAETPEELQAQAARILAKSELAVAQEFLPSDFDWRIGVLNRKPIYACKYHMARGHWQIQTSDGGRTRYGRVEPVPMEQVPGHVLRLAKRSAGLIGDGLYGVDLKDLNGRAVTMEVNDNPSIEHGDEDAFLKDELYLAIMRDFLARLEKPGRRSPR